MGTRHGWLITLIITKIDSNLPHPWPSNPLEKIWQFNLQIPNLIVVLDYLLEHVSLPQWCIYNMDRIRSLQQYMNLKLHELLKSVMDFTVLLITRFWQFKNKTNSSCFFSFVNFFYVITLKNGFSRFTLLSRRYHQIIILYYHKRFGLSVHHQGVIIYR